jgi:hypothetical protein
LALGFVFITMYTCSLGASMPVEGHFYINIHVSIFGVCDLSGTLAYCLLEYAS